MQFEGLYKYLKLSGIVLLLAFFVRTLVAGADQLIGATVLWQVAYLMCGIIILFFVLPKSEGLFKSERQYLFFTMGLALGLRILWNLYAETEPKSDFEFILSSAQMLAGGDYEALHVKYFDLWVYNVPFTLYEFFVLKIFNSVYLLKALSVLQSTFSVFLCYRIVKSASNDLPAARLCGFMAATFPPLIVYTSVLTNQTLSIMFVLLAYDLYFRKKSLLWVGLCLGLAQIFRPTASIFMLGLLVPICLEYLKNTDFKSLKKIIVNNLKVVSAFYFVIILVNIGITRSEIARGSLLYSPASNYKILVGLNPTTAGKYSPDDAKLVLELSEAEFSEVSADLIKERLSDKGKVLDLFWCKIEQFWGDKDAGYYWAGKEWKYDFTMTYYFLLLLAAGLSLIRFFKGRTEVFYGLYLTLLLYIMVHVVFEIQPRYRYDIYPLLIILASLGISEVVRWGRQLTNK